MKVVFCDIDGVLNSHGSTENGRRLQDNRTGCIYVDETCFCPTAISNLNVLIEDINNLWIVISSSWRVFHPLEEIRRMLAMAGFLYPWRILDKTPRGSSRGLEIAKWLETNAEKYEVRSFFAIDDDDFDMDPIKSYLVHTDGDSGFTWKHVKEIKKGFKDGWFILDMDKLREEK